MLLIAGGVEACLHLVSLPSLARVLGVRMNRRREPNVQTNLTHSELRALRAVRFVFRRYPRSNACLREALVTGHVLRAHHPVLVLGVAREAEGVRAHAWVEVAGKPIGTGGDDYAALQPSSDRGTADEVPADPIGVAVRALGQQAVTRSIAEMFALRGIPLLLLKGPDLQQRLYGTPAAYETADVDILVPRRYARNARRALTEGGWVFEPGNSFFWRASGAAHFERNNERVDLHWGLHAAQLPAFALKKLERALWERAERVSGGAFVPDDAALLVYLALHAAGHAFERPQWIENVTRAAARTQDWDRVWEVARKSRASHALDTSLAVAGGARAPRVTVLLDGIYGTALWAASWLVRGHVLPRPVRIAITNIFRRVIPLRTTFAGVQLSVGTDVFFPQPVSEALVDAALDKIAPGERVSVVDVATGCGAVALAIARARTDCVVLGIDVSQRALHWARLNGKTLALPNVSFARGSLLDPLPPRSRGHVRVVTANLPYVKRRERTSDGRPGLPRGSIFGADDDGLGLVRELAREAIDVLEPGGRLAVQVADDQWEALASHLAGLGFRPHEHPQRRPGRALVCWADKP